MPHSCIKFALKFFHIPEQVSDILMRYFGGFFMRFTTTNYTTGWQTFEVGIMMGWVVSRPLFVMCMVLILRGSTDTASGEETRSRGVLPPSRAFMGDVTILQRSYIRSTGPLPWNLHMATDGGKAEEEAKHFHCPWYHLRDPFLHMWQHHLHSQGGASQQSRAALCLPTHRLTQSRLVTEDCPGGLSRHWEGRASWKAQGVMFSAWSLTPPPLALANLWHSLSRVETIHQ